MEEGCIEEKGQHHELLAMNGLYTSMFKIFDQTTMKVRKPESKYFDNHLHSKQMHEMDSHQIKQLCFNRSIFIWCKDTG